MLLLVLWFIQIKNQTKYKFDLPGKAWKKKKTEWGVLWDWGSDVRMRVWAGPHPWSFNPFMPRPSAVMLLSNPRWSRSLSQVSISEWREPDREQTVKASRVCFQGKNLSFCCFHSLNTLSTPEAVFSSTYGDLSLKCCCDCRECSQKRNKHFENIWMHVLSFLWCLWWLIFFFFFWTFSCDIRAVFIGTGFVCFQGPCWTESKVGLHFTAKLSDSLQLTSEFTSCL